MRTWTLAIRGGVECGADATCPRIKEGEPVQLIHLATRTLPRCRKHADKDIEPEELQLLKDRHAAEQWAKEKAAKAFLAKHGYTDPTARPLFDVEPEEPDPTY